MRKLDLDFEFDSDIVAEKIDKLSETFKPASFNRDALREKFIDLGYDINKLDTKSDTGQKNILAVDSSFIEKELQFHCLWALHSVVLYSKFDKSPHEDPVVGHGNIMYSNLMYDSVVDIGDIVPYDQVETRGNLIRMTREYEFLIKNYELLKKDTDIDYLIIDGSLYTNISHIKNDPHKFLEYNTALKAHEEIIKTNKAIGMVEDSHSVDISKQLGINTTNIFLFDIVLNPREYVIDKKDNINICYIKLPSKKLSYTESRRSNPIAVRWEFAFPDFEKDLENLVGMWLLEDDLLHSQIYPVRIADYLTRKIKLGGLLEDVSKTLNLSQRYRDLREG